MRKIYFYVIATLATVLNVIALSSCEADIDIDWSKDHPDHYVEIMQTHKSRTMTFSFRAYDEWIACSNVSWCKITQAKRSRGGEVTIEVLVDENCSNEARAALITVKNTYTQETIVDISIYQSTEKHDSVD